MQIKQGGRVTTLNFSTLVLICAALQYVCVDTLLLHILPLSESTCPRLPIALLTELVCTPAATYAAAAARIYYPGSYCLRMFALHRSTVLCITVKGCPAAASYTTAFATAVTSAHLHSHRLH
jgi:hypothetical protein